MAVSEPASTNSQDYHADISEEDKRALSRITVPLYVVDPATFQIIWLNNAAKVHLDADWRKKHKTASGLPLPSAFDTPHYRQSVPLWLERLKAGEVVYEQFTIINQSEPLKIHYSMTFQPLKDGRPGILAQFISDTSADQVQPRIAQALLHTASMIALFEEDGALIFENPASRSARPKDAEHLSRRFCNERDFLTLKKSLETQSQVQLVSLMKSKNGRRWYDISARRGYDSVTAKSSILFSAIDVTKRLEAEHEVRYLAHHDTLTGLPNRNFLEMEIERHLDEAKIKGTSGALLFIDLDRFKNINDTLGHQVGDDLLLEVAKRLKEIASGMGFVARLGGDEFLLLLVNFPYKDIIKSVAETILKELAKPFDTRGHSLQVTPSIGMTLYPDHGTTLNALMRKADLAMYKAKEQGRNRYCFFTQEMAEHAKERLNMETALRDAIKNEEFELHYQPRLDARTNLIVGAECLLRWDHPRRGMISAGSFIDIAEEVGIIEQIGDWVAKTAIKQQVDWECMGYPINISLNLSPAQFRRPGLATRLTRIADEYKANKSRINLEITENLLLEEAHNILEELTLLREAGFRLEIDDFGTGYSNLGYLQRYPLTALKIDRSFIGDEEKWPIVQLITQMGRLLDLTLVAEGIETSDQLSHINSLDCHEYQGFLYSPAVKPEELETLLSENHSSTEEELA
ncbi:putative bifunctional diguanylate cyclase/phosphodiesterase [Flexibacterium corallicola]|uniref:putative bifunctional diguanylate cyclase/phosphodiesterase n=1 Tax=Flexibacterium corallicola TaxID=3037259 RepID=UPI00286EFAE7|nr:EAL domain-containing protein [Pseudovibrio sp. M1P-2-3]